MQKFFSGRADDGDHSKKEGALPPKELRADSQVYTLLGVIGNGSFGVVYQARVQATGEVVAIKKVLQDKRFKNRELQIMKMLKHSCVVGLRHCFYTNGEQNPDEVYLNLVLEFVPETVVRCCVTVGVGDGGNGDGTPAVRPPARAARRAFSRGSPLLGSVGLAGRHVPPAGRCGGVLLGGGGGERKSGTGAALGRPRGPEGAHRRGRGSASD